MFFIKNSTTFQGIALIMTFAVIGSTGLILEQKNGTKPCVNNSPPFSLLNSSINGNLISVSEKGLDFAELVTKNNCRWILFFSPSCRACSSLIEKKKLPLKNLILMSFAPMSFLLPYLQNHEINVPLFSLDLKHAKLIGIETLPFLIEIDHSGRIVRRISDYGKIKQIIIAADCNGGYLK